MRAVLTEPLTLSTMPSSIRDDYDVVERATANIGYCYIYASERLKQNDAIIKNTLMSDSTMLKYIIPQTRKIVMFAVGVNGRALQFADSKYKNDIGIVLKATTNNGVALQYASIELRKNITITYAAIRQSADAIRYTLAPMDEYMAELAVEKDGLALEHCGAFVGNKDVVGRAVIENGNALEFAHSDLQNNRSIVRLALVNNASNNTISYASRELKKCREIVRLAIDSVSGLAITYADPMFLDDKPMMMIACRSTPYALVKASKRLRADKELARISISSESSVIIHLDAALCSDVPFILDIVRYNPNILIYVDKDIINNASIMLTAVLANYKCFHLIGAHLYNDRNIMMAAVVLNGHNLTRYNCAFCDDKQIALLAAINSPTVIEALSPRLQTSREFILLFTTGGYHHWAKSSVFDSFKPRNYCFSDLTVCARLLERK